MRFHYVPIGQVTNNMDNHKKIPNLSNPIGLKRCYPELASMSDEELVEHYLTTREQKLGRTKKCAPKVRQQVSPDGANSTVGRVISLDKDMTLDRENLKRKSKKNIVQNIPVTATGNNDRLVIELSDYLTLTKTKNIGKFILKPISSKSEKVNPLSPIDKIIKTANTVSLNQVLKGGQIIKSEVDNSNPEPQRTFLLVPQKVGEPVSKKIKLCHDSTTAKKSKTQPTCESSNPAKVLQNIGQINPPNPASPLSSVLQGSKNFFVKIPVSNVQESNAQLSEKSAKRLKKTIQKIQRIDHNKSSVAMGSTVLSKQERKRLKIQHIAQPISVTNESTDLPKQKKKKVNNKNTNSTLSTANERKRLKIQHIAQPISVANGSTDLPKQKKKKVNDKNTNSTLSMANERTNLSKQEKKKSNVVLRAHPYFSQHKPFIIKHKPAGAKATKHQSYPLKDQPGSLLKSEFSVVSISEPSITVEEIKYEMPEQDVDFMVPEESEQSESIDPVFPVALSAPDSDDFEYLTFEDDSGILTESDMQILGI